MTVWAGCFRTQASESVCGITPPLKEMLAEYWPMEIQTLGLGIKPGKLPSAYCSIFFHKINGVSILHKGIWDLMLLVSSGKQGFSMLLHGNHVECLRQVMGNIFNWRRTKMLYQKNGFKRQWNKHNRIESKKKKRIFLRICDTTSHWFFCRSVTLPKVEL